MMSTVIEAKDLSRWYGIVMGLNDISLSIGPGLTGLVGPNGAGKSTLIKIITGQIRPSHGALTVFGEKPFNNPAILDKMGFCPEDDALPDDMLAIVWLKAMALLSGISTSEAGPHVERILNQVRLSPEHWGKPLSQYSKGMRQRVKLAQALIHRPKLLVLDEPMNGLDPMGRQEVQQVLKELEADGTAVLISSHILHELEALCPNILILNWGRVIASGKQTDMQREMQAGEANLFVRCDEPGRFIKALFESGKLLGFDNTDKKDGVNIRVDNPEWFRSNLVGLLTDNEIALHELRSQDHSLQDIFEKMTNE